MKTRVTTPYEQRQDSTWNPARLVVWLICENDRLRCCIRSLEEENQRLRLDLPKDATAPRRVAERSA